MREGMRSHCGIEMCLAEDEEGISMARKLIRRQAGYIAGSVVTKEELAPRKKSVQKEMRKIAPKNNTA